MTSNPLWALLPCFCSPRQLDLTHVDDLEAVCEFERGAVLKKYLADQG